MMNNDDSPRSDGARARTASATRKNEIGKPPPMFESNFPPPIPRRARHAPPSAAAMVTVTPASFGGFGIKFRDVDSSARALAEIQQKRHERSERKRATILIAALAGFGLLVHLVTHASNYMTSSPQPAKDAKNLKPVRSKKYENVKTAGKDPGAKSASKRRQAGGDLIDSDEGGNSTSSRNPTVFDRYCNAKNPKPKATDFPFYFHVPRSGGQSIKDIVGTCMGKIQANEVGVRDGHDKDTALQQVMIDGGRYINVDTTTVEGLQRAASLGFGSITSGMGANQQHTSNETVEVTLPDLMVTSNYFLPAAQHLFSTQYCARAFLLLRNPVGRSVSMFYTRKATGVLGPEVTLEQYAKGKGIENNWLTRYLTGKTEGALANEHLELAKKVLNAKFVVGFLDDMEESVHRLMSMTGWKFDPQKEDTQKQCMQSLIKDGTNKNPFGDYELPRKGTQAYSLLAWQTQYDARLYGKIATVKRCDDIGRNFRAD